MKIISSAHSVALLLSFLVVPVVLRAESVDFLRSIGKLYSVVAVILILFIVLVIYLMSLDRKITRIENENFQNE